MEPDSAEWVVTIQARSRYGDADDPVSMFEWKHSGHAGPEGFAALCSLAKDLARLIAAVDTFPPAYIGQVVEAFQAELEDNQGVIIPQRMEVITDGAEKVK